MTIVTPDDLSTQLNLPEEIKAIDFDLLARKVAAAQAYLESILGYKVEDRFGGVDQDPVPPPLKEATCQLAAHWYENREAAGEGAKVIPFGVSEIVDAYRDWSF
ncbi:head-tail connector protein [Fuscibacter oryzae]|uniref:Phage gp6-like head-tail connector protein n=1 Tax=Fuscibacter oryzae TaxID=2803939 RepID=A0A8J7SUR5_9RHOB|nr:head-tail connector protein [Fuscibacter oryzae]MBL4928787.1 phage gp6-like head-tail connector protein [Fuscibacter oryzae]